MNAILIIIIVLLDIFFYGWLHEKKGFDFFWKADWFGHEAYPIYRTFQFILNCICLWILYPNPWQIAGFLMAHYFLTTDFLYYLIKGDIGNMKYYEGENLYWLRHFFQFGYFIFVSGFQIRLFYISVITGLIILILTNLKGVLF